jgi:hypothetical protein
LSQKTKQPVPLNGVDGERLDVASKKVKEARPGLEPGNNGFAIRMESGGSKEAENSDHETIYVAAQDATPNSSNTNSRSTLGDSCADSDPRLARIIDGWSDLSEEARAALEAVFNASR